jgi:hypothetical protein
MITNAIPAMAVMNIHHLIFEENILKRGFVTLIIASSATAVPMKMIFRVVRGETRMVGRISNSMKVLGI